MVKNKLIKNDLSFTPITIPAYNIIALKGNIKNRMPDFKRAISQGYKIGNFRNITLRRMEEYNPYSKDRTILNSNGFTAIGNPIIGDPANSSEQIIINDLDHIIFESLTSQILNINSSTKFNDSQSLSLALNKDKAKAIYEEIKNKGSQYITIISPLQTKKLRDNKYALPKLREKIFEGLFQGNLSEKRNYEKYLQSITKIKDTSQLLIYEPGDFTDVRLAYILPTVKYFAHFCSNRDLNIEDNILLGVNIGGVGKTNSNIKTSPGILIYYAVQHTTPE